MNRRDGVKKKEKGKRGAPKVYKTFASSSAKTLLPEDDCFRPPARRSFDAAELMLPVVPLGRFMRSLADIILGGTVACPFPFGGCAGLARSRRSSSGARSNRRMIEFISSWFGDSIKANPLDSCVSGLRITLTASATRLSAASHDLISSAVTQTGRFPRNTVKLIL